uniref:Uncharacterized protein n=1 Tax=Rhizophora mucronata TaxID=61149 RepID=A0A2P2QS67_RHIMU
MFKNPNQNKPSKKESIKIV